MILRIVNSNLYRQFTSPISADELVSSFKDLQILGKGDRKALRVDPIEDISPQSIVFCGTERFLKQALLSPASLVVIPKAFIDLNAHLSDKTFLVIREWDWFMAEFLNKYIQETPYRAQHKGIHPTAVVEATAQIAPTASVGPNAYIGSGVKVLSGTFIGANSVIEANCQIGEHTTIHPLTYLGPRTEVGSNCEIHPGCVVGKEGFGYAHNRKNDHRKIPHLGRVIIEDDVHLGAHVAIDRGTFLDTRICRGTKIDNQVHLAHNSYIGENSLLTARFAMAGSSRIGKNFVSGGSSNVTGHIEISDNVQIGGMSGVTKSISAPGQFSGYPLVPLRQFLKIKAAIVKLPEMRKQLKLILKHLNLKFEEAPERDE